MSEIKQWNEAVVDQSAPLASVPVRGLAPAIPLTPDNTEMPVADIASQPANVMRVRADWVLAKVNDRAILLKDRVALRPDEQELTAFITARCVGVSGSRAPEVAESVVKETNRRRAPFHRGRSGSGHRVPVFAGVAPLSRVALNIEAKAGNPGLVHSTD